MAEERSQHEQYNTGVDKVYKGIHSDNNPLEQPRDCHRFALNAVNEATDGEHLALSNEKGNISVTQVPEEFYLIGDRYLEDNRTVVILKQKDTGRDQIGFISKDDEYETVIDTGALGLKIDHQCDIIYRVRRGREKVIYWADGYNKARTFNFNREYDYYTSAFQTYIRGGGNPNTYTGEKWDANAFDLVKSFKSIPFFIAVEIIEVGAIPPGSYNFAIQYVDNDLNPTEWVTTSNTVNIFNDIIDTNYHKIRGSRNTQNSYQAFDAANKSIRLTLSNLDTDFPYYRVAIITGTGVTGQPTEVFASDIQSTSNPVFIYAGNNQNLTKITLEDILIENEIIFAPNHIEQLENRLILADMKGKGVNWCEFQKYASKVRPDLALKDVILNSVLSEPNLKNPYSTFLYRGYMPGEVYSFGIVYVFDDFTLSPAFHIPGASASTPNTQMVPYSLVGTQYEDIHNCSTNNYWGKDSNGTTLLGSPVRHHRFPFRKDIGLPLFDRTGSTTIIQKYKLEFKVSLVSGQTWPTNPDTTDKVITFKLIYKVGSTGSNITITNTVIHSQEGTFLTVYNDIDALGDVSGTAGTLPVAGTVEEVLVVEAGTLSDYVTSGVFTVSGTYAPYNVDSVYNTDTSKIYGIQFSNIEKPREDVIGFYIVRNERKEDDKLVVDNAIFGPMIKNEQYKSFGLIMPKQYYTVNTVCGNEDNCNETCGTKNAGKTLTYSDNTAWFFNPEYQFFNKKSAFNNINIQGQYVEIAVDLPTRKPEYNGCSHYRAIYLQDVQPGTSFNSEVNSGSDSDGFDMMIGYRNTSINWANLTYIFPVSDRTFYLNAASYQNHNTDILYNVSSDNKIGMVSFSSALDTEKFYDTTTKKNNLIYGALTKDNDTAYSNFITRTYYKEHNNPFLFGQSEVINNIAVFNGDAYISPITFNSTIYYDTVVADRKKKTKVWQIVVGAVLIVVGVVAAIFTAGAGAGIAAAGVGVIAAAAISYGVSLAVAGFKFEQFKNMVDIDYSKGLGDTVTDGAVYECIDRTIENIDDTIRWFGDRVTSMYIESSVPFALRDGLTSGVFDFLDSPITYEEDVYRNYLIEKMTIIDRDQGSGRLYKGYATAEFYSMNPDYQRFNKETVFTHLALEYDCCADPDEDFSTRVRWSEQSFQEETVDNYRVFLPNNYKDIEGEHGRITDLFRMGNALFVHSKEALWQLPQTYQERITSEVVSFIGTGSFFEIPPRKLITDNLGSGGTQHKWGTVKNIYGTFFVSEIENKVYRIADKLQEISNEGVRSWFKENLKSYLSQQFYTNLGIPYLNDNNPANPAGIGYLAAFDTRHNRYILTKKDYIYLGDYSNVIAKFDPLQTYAIGKIFIDQNGFEKILSIMYAAAVTVSTTGWVGSGWTFTSTYLAHSTILETRVDKVITGLKANTVYKITYEVFDYVSGAVKIKLAGQEGTIRIANGIYSEDLLVGAQGGNTLSLIGSGTLKVRNINYQEKQFVTQNIPFSDTTSFENKSWTLSYSFYSNSWISWHSYMPLYYIHNQSSLYSFIGNRDIWKHNIEGWFQNFYGTRYPFIVEYVPSTSPVTTKVWETLTFITKARIWNQTEGQYQDDRFTTFNKLVAYTDRGSTGEMNLVVKDTEANPEDWYFHQIVNVPGEILITRRERDWNLNDLRDYTVDPAQTLFSKSWNKLKLSYFADKVVNTANIDYLKNWDELEMLRDKFIIVRLKFDTFDNVNLVFNYSLDTEQKSNR